MAVLLGRTTAGTGATDFNGSGHTALWKFTAVASGRLATIFGQTQVVNSTGTITLGIYTDSAGVASTLLGKATVSGTGTGTGVFSADISGSAIDIVNGTVYWLGWRNSAEAMDFKGDAAGSYDENAGTVDFPTPWTAGSAGSVNAIIWGESAGSTVAPGPPLRIPNPRVGPMAMRHAMAQRFRQYFSPPTGSVQTVATAAINSTASVTGTVVKTAVLAGTVNSKATVSGTVVKTAVLTPTANSVATVTCALVAIRRVQPATINSTAAVTANLVSTRRVQPATVNSVATVNGVVVKTAVLVPTVNGRSTVFATVVVDGAVTQTFVYSPLLFLLEAGRR